MEKNKYLDWFYPVDFQPRKTGAIYAYSWSSWVKSEITHTINLLVRFITYSHFYVDLLVLWGFWTVVLEKTLKSPLDIKEIQPVHPKGDHPWDFFGRNDAEAETPILWPSDVKSRHIGKDPDAGKDWRQEEKGMTEDEMVGWHHWLNGHEFG